MIQRTLFVLGFALSITGCSERPHFSLVQDQDLALTALDKASLQLICKEDDPHRWYDIKQKLSFTSIAETLDLKCMDQMAARIPDFDTEIYFITPAKRLS